VESPVSVPRQFPSFVKTSTVKMSYSTRWRAKKPSLTLNLGTNGLKVTYEPPPIVGQRAACKDWISQRSPIQAAATLDVA
ncbi:hypothetical protein J6590_106706, partial [Homalodisca vitripennis]